MSDGRTPWVDPPRPIQTDHINWSDANSIACHTSFSMRQASEALEICRRHDLPPDVILPLLYRAFGADAALTGLYCCQAANKPKR